MKYFDSKTYPAKDYPEMLGAWVIYLASCTGPE